MDEPQIDPDLHQHLMRFLHLGSEKPIYFPGYWSVNEHFVQCKVIDEILQKDKNNIEVVKVIVNTYKEGYFTRYETIVYALCKCILLGSDMVKAACYKAVPEICETSKELMLFAKYSRDFKSNSGQGWCKCIRKWYNSKDPTELAKELVCVRGHHGMSHSTLLKKCHIKISSDDVPRNAVVKYALFGLQRTKEMLGEKEGAEDIFKYIDIVETFKRCEDPLAGSEMASYYKFSLDLIPTHLLTFPEIWNAILPQMSLSDILNNLLRIHNLGFLASDSSTANMMISLLTDKDLIKKSNLTPLSVFITLNNYCKKTVPMKFEKRKSAALKTVRRRPKQKFNPDTGLWQWTVKSCHPRLLKYWGIDQPPNRDIVTALYSLLNETWLLAPPVGVRYLITMDMREHMFKGRHFCKPHASMHDNQSNEFLQQPSTSSVSNVNNDGSDKISKKRILAECFHETSVIPGQAAIVIASHVLKRERDVTIAVFTDEGIQTIELARNLNIQEFENILKGARNGKVQLEAPIQWAIKTEAKIDVFINMVDRTTRYMELGKKARCGRGPGGRYGPPPSSSSSVDHCPVRALEKYRLQCNQPNSKLIVMSLASHRICTTDDSHSGILDIVGIDKYVPEVIDAFVKGKFN